MYGFKRSLGTFASTSLIIAFVAVATSHTAFGQKATAQPSPVPPPLNVKVVNTPSEPVPVTGSVTGDVNIVNTPTVDARQSGPWNVGIAGTPTVKLDPNNNTVQVAPRSTQLVFKSDDFIEVNDDAPVTLGPFDVSQFSKLRITVVNEGVDTIRVSVVEGDGPFEGFDATAYLIEGFDLGEEKTTSRVYEIPGQRLYVMLRNTGSGDGTRFIRVSLHGN